MRNTCMALFLVGLLIGVVTPGLPIWWYPVGFSLALTVILGGFRPEKD